MAMEVSCWDRQAGLELLTESLQVLLVRVLVELGRGLVARELAAEEIKLRISKNIELR
jgi:hypothetical protein